MAFAATLCSTLCAIVFSVAYILLSEPSFWQVVLGYVIVAKLSFWLVLVGLYVRRY